jgi:large subunit ribosomal protein L24
MIESSKPRKQRHFRFNAPMHARQHFVHAHIDKELREKLGMKLRAIQISRGDTVKVMSGSKRGTTGKVTKVDLRTGRIFIDSLMRKNARGKEHGVGISTSNVYITALNLTDKIRAAKLKVAPQPKEIQAAPRPDGKTKVIATMEKAEAAEKPEEKIAVQKS